MRRFVHRQRPDVAGRDYHCDGLRLDAVHAIFDDSARPHPRTAGRRGRRLGGRSRAGRCSCWRRATSTTPASCARPTLGGLGLDAAWADEWHHALHAALSGDRSGYYEDFGSLRVAGQGSPPGVGVRRRVVKRTANASRAAHRSGCGAISSSCSPRTTTRSATAPSATAAAP